MSLPRLLIVDDLPKYLRNLEVSLRASYQVLLASSMEEAKKVYLEQKPDCALVDVRLKDDDPSNKDGLEFLKWLKEQDTDFPVIVMSAYREFDYGVEAIRLGAECFLKKPIDMPELVDNIASILR